VPGAGFEPARP